MFLFIFESIGTSELILIGIVALIFLGPRRLPEIARKMGKIMTEFRSTTNEFKQTWEREVNFEEEARAIKTGELPETPVPRINPPSDVYTEGISAPEIKEIDAAAFNDPPLSNGDPFAERTADIEDADADKAAETNSLSDKKSWL